MLRGGKRLTTLPPLLLSLPRSSSLNPSPHRLPWPSPCPNPNPSPPPSLSSFFCSLSAAPASDPPPPPRDKAYYTLKLEYALKKKHAEHAWLAVKKLKKIGEGLPDRHLVRGLFSLFSRADDAAGLFHGHKLLSRLCKEEKLDYVDADVLGSLALAFAKKEMFDHSANTIRLMLQSQRFPPLGVWKSVMEHWLQKPAGAFYVTKVFLDICAHFSNGEETETSTSMKPDIGAFNLAVSACAFLGDPIKAEEIIGLMPSFGLLPDSSLFCSLIKAHGKENDIEKILSILLRMKQAQMKPQFVTLNSLLWACIEVGEIDAAEQIVLCWCKYSNPVLGATSEQDSRVLNGDAKVNEAIMEWRRALGSPCKDTLTIILRVHVQNKGYADAATFLQKFYSTQELEYIPCGPAFYGLLKLELRNEVHGILQELVKQNILPDIASYCNLVKAYCKPPEPLMAEAVLEDARKVGHLVDVSLYNSVLDMHLASKDYDCMFLLFREMKRHGITPLEPTFDKLLAVYEKHGKHFLMRKLMEVALRDPPLKLKLHHWNRTILAFCKHKETFYAKQSIKRMKQYGLEPDASTYVFLLGGYILQGGKANEILLLWAEIVSRLTKEAESAPLELTEELLNGFLTFFVKYGYFKNALNVVAYMEERKFWIDKVKFKKLYWDNHKDLYTSKHRSQRRIDMTQERRKQVAAFKSWVGLPT